MKEGPFYAEHKTGVRGVVIAQNLESVAVQIEDTKRSLAVWPLDDVKRIRRAEPTK